MARMVKGSCHCGAVRFEVPEAPKRVTRCTCSFCSKRGARWGYYPPEQFNLVTPDENLSTYRWRSRTIAHYFCAVCGCGTHSDSPLWVDKKPDPVRRRIGINARLLDDFDLDRVPVE
jgi:hypothetical protein